MLFDIVDPEAVVHFVLAASSLLLVLKYICDKAKGLPLLGFYTYCEMWINTDVIKIQTFEEYNVEEYGTFCSMVGIVPYCTANPCLRKFVFTLPAGSRWALKWDRKLFKKWKRPNRVQKLFPKIITNLHKNTQDPHHCCNRFLGSTIFFYFRAPQNGTALHRWFSGQVKIHQIYLKGQ